MIQMRGPWTIQSSNHKYHNDFIDVVEDQVLQPDGQPGTYATVRMKPGVAVLLIDRDGMVYLTRQFRYAAGKESVEVVSGGLDGQEPALHAAQREAREELGVEAENWRDLGAIDIDTSVIHGPVHMFLAQELAFTESDQEGTETIETLKLPLEEAIQMVMTGEITHGPSCVLLLKARHVLREPGAREAAK